MPLDSALWPQNVARDDAGRLTMDGVDVITLAQEFGTPAYLVDEQDFRARAADFRDAFATAFEPVTGGADVYYAGKAFLCSAVARWVQEESLGLDVCSSGELAVAQRVGFPGERITLHGNNKSVAELRQAMQYAVGRVVVDSLTEIDRLSCVAADLGVRARVLVRVTVGVEAHTHGLHSHIGSQIMDTTGFGLAAERLIELHGRIHRVHGIRLPELDLGGGFGASPTPPATIPCHRPSWRAAWRRWWTTNWPGWVTVHGPASPSSRDGRSSGRARSRSMRSARSRTSRWRTGASAPMCPWTAG